MTPGKATALDPNQVYSDLKRMIYKIIHNFLRRYGGDFDELLSEANWHFTQALHTYDPSRSKVITHVYHCVQNGLRRNRKRGNDGFRYAPRTNRPQRKRLSDTAATGPRSGLGGLLSRVSDDAGTVIRLLAAHPGSAKHRRKWVADLLCDYGWATTKVLASFNEIREAI